MTKQELNNDYPVYYDYFYNIEDKLSNASVIRSDVQGTVGDLKADLMEQGIEAKKVFRFTN